MFKTIKGKLVKKIHFVGIKGMAMSGLALMASELGYEVSGSDSQDTYATEKIDSLLQERNITLFTGFDKSHIDKIKPDLVVVSTAYGIKNPEVAQAKTKKIELKTASEMLGMIMSNYVGIGVSGVHGKTTTTALLTYILEEAGFSPGYAIGAPDIADLKGNAHVGEGKYFIAEADEYKKAEDNNQPRFLDLPIKHLIITSIELDHPDVYQSSEDVYQAFYKLSVKIPRSGTIIGCYDSPLVRRLLQRRVDLTCHSYGYSAQSEYQIINFKQSEVIKFGLKSQSGVIEPIESCLLGKHNALNISAALIMATKLGVSARSALESIKTFRGIKRRFEFLGKYRGALFYDDYAHHPTALNYLLGTARERFPDKEIIVVFQPHTFSRTEKLVKEFAQSLSKADQVVLLDIFASAREKSGYFSINQLINSLEENKSSFEFPRTLEDAALYLKGISDENKVIFLVGAGNVYQIYQKILGQKNS